MRKREVALKLVIEVAEIRRDKECVTARNDEQKLIKTNLGREGRWTSSHTRNSSTISEDWVLDPSLQQWK